MKKEVQLRLSDIEAGQVMDGLEMRAEAYERTAAYLSGHDSGEFFVIEEANDADEAVKIGQFYRRILEKMNRQLGKA